MTTCSAVSLSATTPYTTEPSQVTTVWVQRMTSYHLCDTPQSSKLLVLSDLQSKKRHWMLRRWLAAANGVCPECRRLTPLRCRLNTYALRPILQKVEDRAADSHCVTGLYLNHLVCRNIANCQNLLKTYSLDMQNENSYYFIKRSSFFLNELPG